MTDTQDANFHDMRTRPGAPAPSDGADPVVAAACTRHLRASVLIVGAGPAGLATAIGLAIRNVDFVIVDALPEARNTSRAAVIHAATLDVLEDIHVAGELVAQGIQVRHFRARDRDQVLMQADFSGLPGEHRYALMIPQDESERILVDRLRGEGHEVRRSTRLVGLARSGRGMAAVCIDAGGRLVIHADHVVGADGGESEVRAQAGIDFPGRTHGSFLLADVRMDWPLARDEVSLFFSAEGTLVVAPMSRDRYRVVAQLADAPAEPDLADVQRLVDRRGPRSGGRVRELLWGSRFRVHHRIADRFRDGPVLLVGDAAHVHSPAGGQGMNLGLRDARALSEALAGAVLFGDHQRLEAWASERRLAAKEVLRMTDRLTGIATLPNPVLRRIRNHLIATASRVPAVRGYVANTLAGYG